MGMFYDLFWWDGFVFNFILFGYVRFMMFDYLVNQVMNWSVSRFSDKIFDFFVKDVKFLFLWYKLITIIII
jgi:hypothetical protein